MSKFYPVFFREPVFGDAENAEFTQRDARINSDLLRAAVEFIKPKYDFYKGFYTGYNWRVSIEDQHDAGEPEPHYVLDFGEGNLPTSVVKIIKIRYCDNYSAEGRTIEQNPGTFTVELSGSYFHDGRLAEDFAKMFCREYIASLKRHFPDYYILCDTTQLDD